MSDQTEKQAQEREASLKILDDQINEARMYVDYWLAMANNSAGDTRTIHIGGRDGPLMTKEELAQESMRTALAHITRHRELYEARNKFAREGRFE